MAILLVPLETAPGEPRFAASPETVRRLTKRGLEVRIQKGAGERSYFQDEEFVEVGGKLVEDPDWSAADVIFKVAPPTVEEVARMRSGAIFLSTIAPYSNQPVVQKLAEVGVTTFAMELVPRITRAQSMDVLSSQATVAGYKAVLVGASHLSRMCPLLMTAAGTVRPAKVVVFGAGVAGLQAIATAKRLGCLVEATDVRMAAKEQVESLGARFIDVPGMEDMEDAGGYAKEAGEDFLKRQREEVKKRVAEADLVITTAQIPGRPAPRLIDEDMVNSMPPGSVVVDLAVDSGGNCCLSSPGAVVQHGTTKIVGISNLPGSVPTSASELYAKNVMALAQLFLNKEGAIELNLEDDVLAGCLLTHGGEIRHAKTLEVYGSKEQSQ